MSEETGDRSDRRWAQDFGDFNDLLESKGVKPFLILGQEDKHVNKARISWALPYDILTDTKNTMANIINEKKLGEIEIAPSAWHPLITSRPSVGFDPKHPEYDYPHGMTQPAIILLEKQSLEDSAFASATSLYSWAAKSVAPRPKPADAVKHIERIIDAYAAGQPLPVDGGLNEKGFTIGHNFCCGKRRVFLCVIQ